MIPFCAAGIFLATAKMQWSVQVEVEVDLVVVWFFGGGLGVQLVMRKSASMW